MGPCCAQVVKADLMATAVRDRALQGRHSSIDADSPVNGVADPASDMWATGAIAWHVFTGAAPSHQAWTVAAGSCSLPQQISLTLTELACERKPPHIIRAAHSTDRHTGIKMQLVPPRLPALCRTLPRDIRSRTSVAFHAHVSISLGMLDQPDTGPVYSIPYAPKPFGLRPG